MFVRSKLLLASLVAALALCAASAAASAGRLSFSTRTFRATWSPMSLGFNGEFSMQCNITFEGSFHSATFAKVERALIGHVTRASITECPLTVLAGTLPWKVAYYSFSGTLPRITSIKIGFVGIGIRVNLTCLAVSTEAEPWTVDMQRIVETGVVTQLAAEPARGIPVEGFCAGERLRFTTGGTNSLTVLGAATAITLTLI